ncbi:ORF6N domain-containing protein [Azospirillum sp. B21]|uniref:ORF6N domain-containing protein n=1 Tax=Azospirillum sp. B21 TaxID=2607496 RepID=UPI001B3BBD42|nr:ORF6N domain-containing protein [Azospirillum sp. B21]
MSEPFMAARPSCVQNSYGAQTGNIPNIIAFNGVPVMTTERLAHAYGTDPQRIIQNYNRNKARFVQDVHVIRVTGSALRQLKASYPNDIDPCAPSVLLWTERGALAHAKILETDEAWQVYDRLVDTYFAVKEGLIEPPAKKVTTPRLSGALLRELTSFPDKLRAAFPSLSETSLQAAFSRLSGQVLGEPLIPLPRLEGRFYTAGDIATEHDISINRVGRIANEAGIPRDDSTGEMRLGQSEHSSRQVEHWRWNAHGKSLVDAAILEWKTRGVSADVKR